MTAQTCRERNKQLFSLIGRERQRLFSNDFARSSIALICAVHWDGCKLINLRCYLSPLKPGVAVSGPDMGNRARALVRFRIRDFTALAARGLCSATSLKMKCKSPSACGV